MDGIIQWHPGVKLETLEKQAILEAFRFYRGNKTQAAQSLGISIRTLDSKLEQYKVDKESQDEAQRTKAKERAEWLARQRGPTPIGDSAAQTAAIVEREREHARALELARTPKGPAANSGNASESRAEGAAEKTGVLASSGPRVESASGNPAQQPVPLSQRKEVQSVSSRQASEGGSRKAR